ncbi:OsmC family protein [Nocardia yamanashiensis]|uniref:OsmC family protein n=1 Tax=Nocardia yamanashiensis TaxID=209247 RepID=UPI001E3374C5|nr:OsmC family protein [Nocardia yamanashiensis]UGT45092.1 OsmC family protein [Nocardia yamanashiensis]
MAEHVYEVSVTWSGATTGYRDYSRNHLLLTAGPPPIEASADPVVGRGDGARWNPEQLLVASLADCHMLWYLHLCVDAGVVVTDYRDDAVGVMDNIRFQHVTLRPRVTVTEASMVAPAEQLHAEAHKKCFIANSVNFPVGHEPVIVVG